MLFKSLTASPTLALVQYPDIDSFRMSERYVGAQSIPIQAGDRAIPRARLSLPSCSLSLVRTFPRIIKGYDVRDRVLVVVPMDTVSSARINGREIGQSLLLMSGAVNCIVHEPEGRLVAILSIRKDVLDLGLDRLDSSYALLDLPADWLEALQLLLYRLLESAALDPEAMHPLAEQQAAERLIFAALNEAARIGRISSGSAADTQNRHHAIVDRMDRMLRQNPAEALNFEKLADAIGVSTRTLHNATHRICGLSALRYLRVRRLWMVRDQLRSGTAGLTVKASALAHGFHHMGEFSEVYRLTFGELPSQTLADGRQRLISPPA